MYALYVNLWRQVMWFLRVSEAAYSLLSLVVGCAIVSGFFTGVFVLNIEKINTDLYFYTFIGILALIIVGAVMRAAYAILSVIVPRPTYRSSSGSPRKVVRGGFVYLIRRKEDGVYKIGKTMRLNRRLPQLRGTYGPFKLIHCWKTKHLDALEKIALNMTQEYFYKERSSQELRQMTHAQARKFISDFEREVETYG